MFEVDKPRKFHYVPRFYDPEKEKWEALKQKYADEHQRAERLDKQAIDSEREGDKGTSDKDLAYFQQRVRQLDNEKRDRNARLGWKDLFRKREMPKFRYESRFDENGNLKSTTPQVENLQNGDTDTTATPSQLKYSPYQIKIRRRFDIGDSDYMKPISGTKIILYCFLVCLLLYWILF